MGEWQRQAIIGVLGGGGAFVAVFLPIVVLQFRRYGRTSIPRLIGAAAVSVYAVALVAYTFLPLPDPQSACSAGGIPAQVRPFAFVDDIAKDVGEHGTSALLAGRATVQVAFNVLLFVPLGIIARRFWSFGVAASAVIGLLSSFTIEATQYTGIWGLYPCAYRVADVDDLLANTSGALIGALVAPLVLWWMPRTRDLRARRLEARPVSVWRRWLGMVLDLALFTAVSTTVTTIMTGARLLGGLEPRATPLENVVVAAVTGVSVFFVPALVGSGASIGQRLVWLRPVAAGGGRPPTARRLTRVATTGGAYTASVLLGSIQAGDVATSLVVSAGAALATLLVALAVVMVPFTRGHRGLSGVVSGTETIDSRTPNRRAPVAPRESTVP
jgi:glycopeptide antibiotics resistance protein